MNNKYERTINLKQETHLVHFQIKRGDVEKHRTSPTLRASEVKPRLDKEIVKYFKRNNIVYNDWLAFNADESEDFSALNYKMSIDAKFDSSRTLSKNAPTANDSKGRDNEKDLSYLLFTNFDKEVDDEFVLSLYKETKINIKSIVTKTIKFNFNGKDKEWNLLEFIEEFINYFLIVYSFGYRQLKCFGVYNTINDIKDLDKIKVASKLFPDKNILVYKANQNLTINKFYKIVKKYIEKVRRGKKNSAFVDCFGLSKEEKNNCKCLRMLFGLSNIYDKKQNLLNENRFPSPLSFKKFGDYVLLVIDKELVNEIPEVCVYKSTDIKTNIEKTYRLNLRKKLLGVYVDTNSFTDKKTGELIKNKKANSRDNEYERLNLAYEYIVCKAFEDVNKPYKGKNKYGNNNTNKKVSNDFVRVM